MKAIGSRPAVLLELQVLIVLAGEVHECPVRYCVVVRSQSALEKPAVTSARHALALDCGALYGGTLTAAIAEYLDSAWGVNMCGGSRAPSLSSLLRTRARKAVVGPRQRAAVASP